jgi:drug/metabolite transporter (DMT)-like permease
LLHESERKRFNMSKRTIPGLILAIIGMILFGYQGVGQRMRKSFVKADTTIRRAHANQSSEEGFPIAPLVAGCLFMSGIGLVAISAHPAVQPQQGDPEA